MAVVDDLRQLISVVESIRLVGFGDKWTADTLFKMQMESTDETRGESNTHVKRRCPSDLFPLVLGQSSFFDCGPTQGVQLQEHLDIEMTAMEQLSITDSNESVKTVLQSSPTSPKSDISDRKTDRRRFGRLFE